ncbi:unnamed protein product [Brachionus calyciflorus]|uniref:Uncharacterized protein n=1 Tax=Brachionus calyciflorus TaxID=104777 RepID=A0A814GWX1_9BILA|nr:unnamed protein product [Brachionus calyciflorus]
MNFHSRKNKKNSSLALDENTSMSIAHPKKTMILDTSKNEKGTFKFVSKNGIGQIKFSKGSGAMSTPKQILNNFPNLKSTAFLIQEEKKEESIMSSKSILSLKNRLDSESEAEADIYCEPCLNFQKCLTNTKFESASSKYLTSKSLQFRPINVQHDFSCSCPMGCTGTNISVMCDTEFNLCFSNPCGHNGVCIRVKLRLCF